MKIAFYIARLNYLGHLGPLIDYCNEINLEILILCDHRIKKSELGLKKYLFPEINEIQQSFPNLKVVAFKSLDEFSKLTESFNFIFLIAYDKISHELQHNDQINNKFIHLQTGGDIFLQDIPKKTNMTFVFGEQWRHNWLEWNKNNHKYETIKKTVKSKTEICGYFQGDGVKQFSKSKIKEKYGIAQGKNIVLYLPFPWSVKPCLWSHTQFKYKNKILKSLKTVTVGKFKKVTETFQSSSEIEVVQSIRKFCDNNNALFIVKGRKKNQIPDYINNMADNIIYDFSNHPYTILEMMFISDIAIHYYSESIKEAIVTQTPSICLGPEDKANWVPYAERMSVHDYSHKPCTFYNYEGIVYSRSVNSFEKSFPQEDFNDYKLNSKSLEEFTNKFFYNLDYKACERIINRLKAMNV